MTSTTDSTDTDLTDGHRAVREIDVTDPYADDPAFVLHQGGKLAITSRVPIDGPEDLSLAYTPGVAEPCLEIARDAAQHPKITENSAANPSRTLVNQLAVCCSVN